MKKPEPMIFSSLVLAALVFVIVFVYGTGPVSSSPLPGRELNPEPDPLARPPAQEGGQPVFRFPVVPGSTLSGYFDHNLGNDLVTFYNGSQNVSPGFGFFFSCPSVGMVDFVGCQDGVSGEGACSNSRELWYDGHKGVDMEYSSQWHTGDVCDPGRFAGVTSPVYAPAAGKVHFAGYDPYRPGNGWHIRLKHDLNQNGNYDDDNFRSIYLHFTANALAVTAGQVVAEGEYLGLGGSTGYSSSPHLHFEIQRSSDYFASTYWSVDPYGWQGEGQDPWPYQNILLWRPDISTLDKPLWIPVIMYSDPECTTCQSAALANGDFEEGRQSWVEAGVEIIARFGEGHLTVAPYSGEWLAWLGGRDNAADVLSQAFLLPPGQSEIEISYFLRVDTYETGGVYDVFSARLQDENGNLIQEIDAVDNAFSSPGQWVQRAVTIAGLESWAGQNLWLSFEGRTDGNALTSFYVDDVTLVSR